MMTVNVTLASANQSVTTLLYITLSHVQTTDWPTLPPLNLPSEKTLPCRGQGDWFWLRFMGEDDNSVQTCLVDGPLTSYGGCPTTNSENLLTIIDTEGTFTLKSVNFIICPRDSVHCEGRQQTQQLVKQVLSRELQLVIAPGPQSSLPPAL